MFRSKLRRGLTRALTAYVLAYLVAMQGLFAAFASESVEASGGTIICSQDARQNSSKERHPAHAPCCTLMSCCLGLQTVGPEPAPAPVTARDFSTHGPFPSADAAPTQRAARRHFSARAPPSAV